MLNIRDSRALKACGSILAALVAAACVAVEPGGHPGTSGGGSWPAPRPPQVPERPVPVARPSLLSVEPSPLDFGPVEVDELAELECTLSNRGGAEARILSIGVDGRDLRLPADGCSGRRLDRGDSCTFRVRYAPSDPGPLSGGVSIVAADPVQRKLQIAVLGTERFDFNCQYAVGDTTAAGSVCALIGGA